MQELLSIYYGIEVNESIVIADKIGWRNKEYTYFTISGMNKEEIFMEQASAAVFLHYNGYPQIALPIQNNFGEWLTRWNDQYYMVLFTWDKPLLPDEHHGVKLANFHKKSQHYPYQPMVISNFKQWKDLWIERLTNLEKQIIEVTQKQSEEKYRYMLNIMPYIIGICENAIQYIREAEQEEYYAATDKAAITFIRYQHQLTQEIIWLDEFVYDYPIRDVTEYIRNLFLSLEDSAVEEAWNFLRGYESVLPFSKLSWRLLIGRLLFPIHIMDQVTDCLSYGQEELFDLLKQRIENQSDYEQKLKRLFQIIGQNNETLLLPVVKWI
ncbi:hypothetical protein AB4Y30_12000 [Ornithinibacillus sp. 4-3]|uniref:Spore coat protein YutH n=1 Tax=Ornithinibacillus sp. 4-3 TaxID=3231488 RepID=A0AB39HM26_9BACI